MEYLVDNLQQRAALYHSIQSHIDLALKQENQIALLNILVSDIHSLEISLGFTELEQLSSKLYQRILACTKNANLVFQIALDNFLVVVPKMLNNGHLKLVAERITREIHKPIIADQDYFEFNSSIGLAGAIEAENNAANLFRNSLIARQNKNAIFSVFSLEDKIKIDRALTLRKEVDLAIQDNQFELYFQPKIGLKKMKVVGAEALIRWQHPLYGTVSPDEFIPACEATGQIKAITEWVIKSAIQRLSQFCDMYSDFKLSINVPASSLDSRDLMLLLEDTIDIWDISPNNLVVEITETTIMNNAESALNNLKHLKELGIGISIDDFGTGYSSLSYFKKLPATELKIDKSFIDHLLDDENDKDIVALIIFLAKKFNLDIVAEGIESKPLLEAVCNLQCDYAQGYYFSKPLDFDHFVIWVDQF